MTLQVYGKHTKHQTYISIKIRQQKISLSPKITILLYQNWQMRSTTRENVNHIAILRQRTLLHDKLGVTHKRPNVGTHDKTFAQPLTSHRTSVHLSRAQKTSQIYRNHVP